MRYQRSPSKRSVYSFGSRASLILAFACVLVWIAQFSCAEPTCQSTNDCIAEQLCQAGKCVQKCESTRDCLGEQVCSADGTCKDPTTTDGSPSDTSGTQDNPQSDQGTPDRPCQPKTCTALKANCGDVPDGCGKTLNCGVCETGKTCGGGGSPNVCGEGVCPPKTCASQGANCGSISDGCGKIVDCGQCQAGRSCGSGNNANKCICQPKTCASENTSCGELPDGCGNTIKCGDCPSGKTCQSDGNGRSCSDKPCTPKSCRELKAVCGQTTDGCGKSLDCGKCPQGKQCNAQTNQCVCQPKTCKELNKTCGQADDGCGNTIDCGVCPVCKPSCPNGYKCSNGTCTGGNPKAVELNVRSITLAGKVTLNGATPKILSTTCRTSNVFTVRFQELTYGYDFRYTYNCEAVRTNGFVFSTAIYPGTYKVSVRGEANVTDLPRGVYQVILDKVDYKASTSGLTYNVKSINVSGKVTLNGATPKILSTTCRTSNVFTVRFQEETYAYDFRYTYNCEAVRTNGFVFSSAIYPGTYKVSVRGEANVTDLPRGVYQVILNKAVYTSTKSGLTYDVKSINVAGKVTLNGATPKILSTTCRTSNVFTVRFQEATYAYDFRYTYNCEAVRTNGFVFSSAIYPGTYKVSVRGEANVTDLPRGVYQVILNKVDYKTSTSGLTYDVKSINVAGKVTLNGATPKILSTTCRTSNVFTVRFQELSFNYDFRYTYNCEAVRTNGFVFSTAIYPGTYKVSVRGEANVTDLPRGVYQVILDKVDYKASTSGLTYNVKSINVAGKVTLNGATPKILSTTCRTSNVFTVRFQEETYAYDFRFTYNCEVVRTNGFVFSSAIYPGTYKVSVRGEANVTDLPRGVYQVILNKVDYKTSTSGLTYDVKSVGVAGKVTLNGATPKILSTTCRTSNVFTVRFQEATYAYDFRFTYNCEAVRTNGFVFSVSIYPGIYKVSVRGEANVTDLPRGVYQVIVERLQVP